MLSLNGDQFTPRVGHEARRHNVVLNASKRTFVSSCHADEPIICRDERLDGSIFSACNDILIAHYDSVISANICPGGIDNSITGHYRGRVSIKVCSFLDTGKCEDGCMDRTSNYFSEG